MRIHHVNLVVPPGTVEEVARFWVEVFDLRRIERQGRSGRPGAWLAGDGVEIHLSEREGAVHPDQHVAVVVPDFAATRSAALDRGAPWEDVAPVEGDHRGFTRDPGGNRIEVMG